jgi:hypothetical protein
LKRFENAKKQQASHDGLALLRFGGDQALNLPSNEMADSGLRSLGASRCCSI